MNETYAYLGCSCCGNGITNNADENVSFNESPYPHDEGFGMCRSCGGDPTAKSAKKRLGWATTMFCEARFPVLRDNMKPEHKQKWDALTYERKCSMTLKAVEKGILSW